jgi:hypothetical protein
MLVGGGRIGLLKSEVRGQRPAVGGQNEPLMGGGGFDNPTTDF